MIGECRWICRVSFGQRLFEQFLRFIPGSVPVYQQLRLSVKVVKEQEVFEHCCMSRTCRAGNIQLIFSGRDFSCCHRRSHRCNHRRFHSYDRRSFALIALII